MAKMSAYPSIPNRYFFLLSATSQDSLKAVESRKASVMSAISTLSFISEFLEHKIQDVDLDIDYIDFSQKGLVESFESKNMETSDLDAAIEAVEEKYRRRRKKNLLF